MRAGLDEELKSFGTIKKMCDVMNESSGVEKMSYGIVVVQLVRLAETWDMRAE